MDWKALWSAFRNTVYFRIVYLFIIVLMVVLLLPSGLGCLSFLLAPVLMVLVPHSFGERRLRNHAVNGLFVILLVPVIYSFLAAPSLASPAQIPLSSNQAGVVFSEGLVMPFNGTASTEFLFSVNVTTGRTDAANLSVRLGMFDYQGIDTRVNLFPLSNDPGGDGDLSNGEDYSANVTLPPALHRFFFLVVDPGDTIIASTAGSWGPVNAPYDTIHATVLAQAYLSMLLVAFGFFLILMLYWWTRKARAIRGGRAPPEKKRAEGGGEFTCTNCGADVSEADTKCPSCGASFEPEAEGEAAEAKA